MSATSGEHGEILKAINPGAGQIEVGMDVIGVDGRSLGRVKEVRVDDFLLDLGPMDHDLYVPYRSVLPVPDCGESSGRNLEVGTVGASQVEDQDWARP